LALELFPGDRIVYLRKHSRFFIYPKSARTSSLGNLFEPLLLYISHQQERIMRIPFLLLILLMGLSAEAQETVFVETAGNYATVWNTEAFRNCGFLADMEIQQTESHFTITEVDTGMPAFCNCYFDLSATIGPLDPGDYTVDVYSICDYEDLTFRGTAEFSIIGIALIEETNSGCQRDTNANRTSLELEVIDADLRIYWDPILNCCLQTQWSGYLSADTFYLSMLDVGDPCDCNCPFELNATFGPFNPGTYYLDFLPDEFGNPQFVIPGQVARLDIELQEQYQSPCYEVSVAKRSVAAFSLQDNFPNPFNPQTTINFELKAATSITLDVFDTSGGHIRQLASGSFAAGNHEIQFDATGLSSGMYFYKISSAGFYDTRKMILLK
jgi:hypothetical protein